MIDKLKFKTERLTIENGKLTKQASKKNIDTCTCGNTYSTWVGAIGNRAPAHGKLKTELTKSMPERIRKSLCDHEHWTINIITR